MLLAFSNKNDVKFMCEGENVLYIIINLNENILNDDPGFENANHQRHGIYLSFCNM